MSLQWLRIENVRCIARAELELDARSNLISGPNASGKTTLLEAIFLLGRGRSFRTPRLESLVRTGCGALRVVGRSLAARTSRLSGSRPRAMVYARVSRAATSRVWRSWPLPCRCKRSTPTCIA